MFNFLRRRKRPLHTFVSLGRENWLSGVVAITEEDPKDTRIKREPIKVMHELDVKINIPLDNLDKMITEMKKRKKVMLKCGINPGEEDKAIEMLEWRKKYGKYSYLFGWPTTIESRITKLCNKYMLRHRPLGEFIKNVPEKAITEMSLFTDAWDKIVKTKDPDFSIIAPDSDFKSTDPILLVKAPFGEFYYVLCAWDKEVSIVGELLNGDNYVIPTDEV